MRYGVLFGHLCGSGCSDCNLCIGRRCSACVSCCWRSEYPVFNAIFIRMQVDDRILQSKIFDYDLLAQQRHNRNINAHRIQRYEWFGIAKTNRVR